jgi:hypothetical protein
MPRQLPLSKARLRDLLRYFEEVTFTEAGGYDRRIASWADG